MTTKNITKISLLCLLTLFSSGCVGSTLIYGPDETPQGDYPDLHSVPDKPHFDSPQEAQKLEQNLEAGYEESLALNKRLRNESKPSHTPIF